MNQPYVKKYQDGILINPIEGSYPTKEANRKERRIHLQKQRFFGNGKNTPLSFIDGKAYRRSRQYIHVRDSKTGRYTGEIRRIEHYLPKTK